MIFPRQYLPVPTPGVADPGPGLPRGRERLFLRAGMLLVRDLDGRLLGMFATVPELRAWLGRRPGESYLVSRWLGHWDGDSLGTLEWHSVAVMTVDDNGWIYLKNREGNHEQP